MTSVFEVSVKSRIAGLRLAIGKIEQSLQALQKQDSDYANDHRKLIAAYQSAIDALERSLVAQ